MMILNKFFIVWGIIKIVLLVHLMYFYITLRYIKTTVKKSKTIILIINEDYVSNKCETDEIKMLKIIGMSKPVKNYYIYFFISFERCVCFAVFCSSCIYILERAEYN